VKLISLSQTLRRQRVRAPISPSPHVIGFPISDQITWALASAGAFFVPWGDLLAHSVPN
jgi:hypothetical protein